MEQELVSVIMPAYNAEKYIEMSIASVIQQTYKNVELVIVDDGSTDNTLKIIHACSARWPDQIRVYVREQNGGTAAALNDAIELAKGKYICWLSADDLYCEDMVLSEVNYLKQKKRYDAVFSRCGFIDGDNQFLGMQKFAVDEENFASGMTPIVHLLLFTNFWHGCTLLAKAECFKREERFNVEYKASQDYDFWLRMAADYEVGYLDRMNVFSREHSGQGSKKMNCCVDEIKVFFNILCREDIMRKLFKKMGRQYSYENIRPYIEYRIERYKGMEEEMNAISQGLQGYMQLMEAGRLQFQQ